MKRMAGLGILILTLALTAKIEAQSRGDIHRRGYFGFGGGLAVPSGEFGAAANLGWTGQGFVGFTTRGGILGGRFDATFARTPSGPGNYWMVGGMANGVLTPGHRPAGFHPYVLGGVGLYHVNSTGGSGETKLALSGGAGVQLHLNRSTDIYSEARFLSIRTGNAINLFPITLGFRWGGI